MPPIAIPSPPSYPFYVATDAATKPEASIGSGPYALRASSSDDETSSDAVGGFADTPAGNAALVRTSAKLKSDLTGVVAAAVTDVQGLTIGPVTIGQITSKAAISVDELGKPTPTSSLSVAGLRVGGIAVELKPSGLVIANQALPVPISDVLKQLQAAGTTVEYVPGQTLPDRVISEAIKITFPFEMPLAVPNVGKYSGSATLIIGASVARMAIAETGSAVPAESTLAPVETGGQAQMGESVGGPTAPIGPSAGAVFDEATTSGPSTSGASANSSLDAATQPTAGLSTGGGLADAGGLGRGYGETSVPDAELAAAEPPMEFDSRSAYLTVGGAALMVLVVSQLVRRLGRSTGFNG